MKAGTKSNRPSRDQKPADVVCVLGDLMMYPAHLIDPLFHGTPFYLFVSGWSENRNAA